MRQTQKSARVRIDCTTIRRTWVSTQSGTGGIPGWSSRLTRTARVAFGIDQRLADRRRTEVRHLSLRPGGTLPPSLTLIRDRHFPLFQHQTVG